MSRQHRKVGSASAFAVYDGNPDNAAEVLDSHDQALASLFERPLARELKLLLSDEATASSARQEGAIIRAEKEAANAAEALLHRFA